MHTFKTTRNHIKPLRPLHPVTPKNLPKLAQTCTGPIRLARPTRKHYWVLLLPLVLLTRLGFVTRAPRGCCRFCSPARGSTAAAITTDVTNGCQETREKWPEADWPPQQKDALRCAALRCAALRWSMSVQDRARHACHYPTAKSLESP